MACNRVFLSVDKKVFNRNIENLEVEKTNQNIILTTDNSKINFQKNLEQKKIAKAKDADVIEKIIEDSIKDEKKKKLWLLKKILKMLII